jgi:hypothetical protein
MIAHPTGEGRRLGLCEVAHPVCDLLGAGNHQSLPLLHRLDEGGCLDQRSGRPGDKPGDSPPQRLHQQRAEFQDRGNGLLFLFFLQLDSRTDNILSLYDAFGLISPF